jgi:hypothetical protein
VTTLDEHLLRIDPANGSKTATLTLPAIGFSASVGEGAVWLIVSLGNGQVWSVDPDSAAATSTRSTKFYPTDLTVGRGLVWVSEAEGTVRRIDLRTGAVRTTRIGLIPEAIAADEHGAWVALQRPS